MNNEIVNAMEELENWLADPTELCLLYTSDAADEL